MSERKQKIINNKILPKVKWITLYTMTLTYLLSRLANCFLKLVKLLVRIESGSKFHSRFSGMTRKRMKAISSSFRHRQCQNMVAT